MSSFNIQLDKMFPRIESFLDFSGSHREFEMYVKEMCPDHYTIVAQDTQDINQTFELYLNDDLYKSLAQLRIEIVEKLSAPLCQASVQNNSVVNLNQPSSITNHQFIMT